MKITDVDPEAGTVKVYAPELAAKLFDEQQKTHSPGFWEDYARHEFIAEAKKGVK